MNCVVGWPGSWPRICSNKCCLRIVRLPGARFGRPVTLLSGKMRPEVDYCCRGSGFVGQNRAVPPDWVVVSTTPLPPSQTLLCPPEKLHSLSRKGSTASLNLPSPQLHVAAIASLSPQTPITSLSMFRNALRQSTRAVGAVSAASRVSVVSTSSAPDPTEQAIESDAKHHAPS